MICVNGETITAEDLCLPANTTNDSLIEYWFIHEIEDEVDAEEAQELEQTVLGFGRCNRAKALVIETSIGRYRIDKI